MSVPAQVEPPACAKELRYDALPNATSIRILDVVESGPTKIRCEMRVVDLDSDPKYAALSYTWDNPITVYERPLSDPLTLKHLEDPDKFKFPFERSIRPPGLGGEYFPVVDGARREYYVRTFDYGQNLPYEKVDGQSTTRRVIEVNGCPVLVRENLYDFVSSLGELRRHMSGETLDAAEVAEARDALQLPIWVDAVCINQDDLSERAAQVHLMERIFKSAVHVLAWVGPSDRLANEATEAIRILLDYSQARSRGMGRYLELTALTLSNVPEMTATHWFALFAFFQRRWFRRAWVAQELVLARHTYVVHGETMLDMALIQSVLGTLHELKLSHQLCEFGRAFLTGETVSDPGSHLTTLLAFANANNGGSSAGSPRKSLAVEPKDVFDFVRGVEHVRRCTQDGDQPRLLAVISAFRNLGATDPRDKIFAFLNLAAVDRSLFPSTPGTYWRIVPDYRASVQDVFRTATAAIIKETRRLSVLSHVQDAQDTITRYLPTWVPDFSARLGRAPLDDGSRTLECDFRACGGSEGVRVVNPDGTLDVRGLRIDTVSTATEIDVDPLRQILKVALGVPARYPGKPLAWCSTGAGKKVLRPRALSRVEALWRTLMADNVFERRRGGVTDDADDRDYFSGGFSSWVLQHILLARVALHEHAGLDTDHWVRKLASESLCSKLALWAAMYDGHQTVADSELSDVHVPDFKRALKNLYVKRQDERDQYQLDQHLGINDPTIGILDLPTANRLMESVFEPIDELEAEIVDDYLCGTYRLSALARLRPEERGQAAAFENRMREATEERSLFCTRGGRLALGPKSVGKEPNCKDEVWILQSAKVPFILRREKDGRYRVVGEAYVHGIMYGERTVHDCNWEDVNLI
ncbi:heterokaryon incompatibility protein-domain-containing protein [Parachaetomium inaequale]|uniref:Heterokaryon incompatibility protein-domain-containing protein n=1 Tax=Parachaetomium inaequale TaxID=2588326 RepID=A0AAN6PLX9_9PEZI|nr:heterokaryon incompatibility protein-domain-containing protein [Parachaetomium inaequale]